MQMMPSCPETVTLASYLRQAARGIRPALVTPACLARVERLVEPFPAARIAIFGFECHLTERPGTADFAFKMPDAAALADCLEFAGPDRTGPRAPLDRLLQAWQKELPVESLCFEYDIPCEGPAAGPPSLFFAAQDPRATLARTVAIVKSEAFHASVQPALSRALDLLPENATLPMWGIMLARDLPAVRLCASRILPAQARPYLESQGWEGNACALDEVLAWSDAHVRRIMLDWDAGSRIYPKVGVEFYFKEPLPPVAPYPWEPLLHRLTARGLCRPEAAQALLRFPGVSEAVEDLPVNVQAAAALIGHRQVVFLRKLSHFKLVIGASGELLAKAYLEFRLCWRGQAS